MNKKALSLLILFSVFTCVSLVFIGFVEVLGYQLYGQGTFINYLLVENNVPSTYRILAYSLVAISAMHFAMRSLILFCSKNKMGLSIDLAIKFIDDKSLRKIYLSKWVKD